MASNPAFDSATETSAEVWTKEKVNENQGKRPLNVEENKTESKTTHSAVMNSTSNRSPNVEVNGWGARHTLGLLVFLGLTLGFMVRTNLSIAIVAMVGTKTEANDTRNHSDVCPVSNSVDNDTYVKGDFDWDEHTQGMILGAFFWGYTATTFAGGRAAEYLGGRLMFGLSVVVPSTLALFSAVCVSVSKELFIVLRVLQGMTQGALSTASTYMLAAWIPPHERGSYCVLIFSGTTFGTILAMSLGGWLCNTEFLGGWPSVFYVFGGLGVVWGLPWFLLTHNLPEQHPSITSAELTYIITHRTYVSQRKTIPLPVREIFTSIPFWTLMVTSIGCGFVFFTLLTELPTYFSNIQHFDLSSNGVRSALPYVIQLVTSLGWSAVISVLSTRNLITVAVVRKLSTGIGMYGSAAALVAMMWVKCNSGVAMAVMCVAVGAMGTIGSGSAVSEQDIAPNFAGSLKGITDTIGAATGFLAPAITGAIIYDNQTLNAWRAVFGLSAGLAVASCTVFILLGTDKVQPWNNPKPNSKKESDP